VSLATLPSTPELRGATEEPWSKWLHQNISPSWHTHSLEVRLPGATIATSDTESPQALGWQCTLVQDGCICSRAEAHSEPAVVSVCVRAEFCALFPPNMETR
jgi:hypothetical protein